MSLSVIELKIIKFRSIIGRVQQHHAVALRRVVRDHLQAFLDGFDHGPDCNDLRMIIN